MTTFVDMDSESVVGDLVDLSPVSIDDLKGQSNKQQHDLEKLQEAHDRLMHEIEEKRNLTEKIHLQLDRTLELNDEFRATIIEREEDIKYLEAQIAQKDALISKYQESELQIPKLKALAVKLKKQLAETREELDRKSVCSSPAKESSKQQSVEIDRLSNLYQSSVKNFQALQTEFDKLQDEYDQLLEKRKRSDSDLNQTISELNKLRVSAAEAKHENEMLIRRVAELEKESEVNFTKRKELESKVIVIQNELMEEKKKLVNQAGLEKTLMEIRKQVDLKTSEVVDLSDLLEKDKEVQAENVRLNSQLVQLETRLKQLESENEEAKEQNWNLSRKIESIISSNENEKIRLVELVTENNKLTKDMQSIRDQFKRKKVELEEKLIEYGKKIEESREELEMKNSDFENYKSKVFKVLTEKESNHLELHEIKTRNQELELQVRSCEDKIGSLNHQLETAMLQVDELKSDRSRHEKLQNSIQEGFKSQLEESRREFSCLKSLNRELQNQLVAAKMDIEEKTKRVSELETLQQKLQEAETDKQRLELELKTRLDVSRERGDVKLEPSSESTTLTPERAYHGGFNSSPKSIDDVDSIGSTSLSSRTKRLSMSSVSDPMLGVSNNVLEELMNLKFDEDDGSNSERGSGTVEGNEETNLKRFRELLEESEAGNILLTEQNRVLKEEIRRLERAMSRIELAQNLEYLKNVLVKFVSLENGSSEKRQLVSVLKTILKLNEEEESLLIKDATKNDQQSQNSNTWTSYIWN